MTGLSQLKQLEQWMTYIRWMGVAFGIVGMLIQPDFPDATTERLAWILLTGLALSSLIIWGASGRIESEQTHRRLGMAAFCLDAAIVMGFVWVYTFQDPYIIWASLIIVPLEGALRFRLQGALAAAVGVTLFFIPQNLHFADLHDRSFDPNMLVFLASLATLVAAVAGSMAEHWHAQSKALEEQRAKLAEADRLKDRFLAVTSHEIRGPLTAIISGVETVRKRGERLRPEQRETLMDIVAAQGRQLARLVDDLLVTSQLQVGRVALRPEWTDLESTITQAVEGAEPKRRGHRLELFVEPMGCEVDPARLGQIVRNLVENAYKYTPDQSSVAVVAKREPGGILVEVADDGEGIPEEKRAQLFDAFTQIDETSAGKDGVGLGLFVVSQLVAAMHGRIDLASSSQGTTFRIHIPCPTGTKEGGPLGLVSDDDDGSSRSVSSQRP